MVLPIGIDIGGSVKVSSGELRLNVPSIIGNPNPGWSGITTDKDWVKNLVIIDEGEEFYIGELARLQSETKRVLVEKGRVENLSDVFSIIKAILALFLTEGQQIVIATGVPISTNYDLMKQMSATLKGKYDVYIENDATSEERKVSFEILKTLVMPEAYGSYYHVVSESGRETAPDAITISLDYLTEILTIYQGRPMRLASGNMNDASLAVLANKIALTLQQVTNQIVSPLDILPNLNNNYINVGGRAYDITESKEHYIREIGRLIADQLKALIASLPYDAQIEHYIITGEGMSFFWKEVELHLLEEEIVPVEDIRKFVLPEDPIFANVKGFEDLARKTVATTQQSNSST